MYFHAAQNFFQEYVSLELQKYISAAARMKLYTDLAQKNKYKILKYLVMKKNSVDWQFFKSMFCNTADMYF